MSSCSATPEQTLQRTAGGCDDQFATTFTKSARARDHCGFDLISDALPFGRLWYDGPEAVPNAIGYAQHRSRSHRAVIHAYDAAGNVIETHDRGGDFKEC